MNKRSFAAVLLVGLVITLAMFFLPVNKDVAQADVIVDGELRGWAWSSNIGWLSFNSKDTGAGGGAEYSVKFVTGRALSGYAWSSNIGWIKFNPDFTGPADMGDNFGAKLMADRTIKGWVRACSVFVSGCDGALKPDYQRGGWDGWVKMIDVKYDSDSNGYKDFAWGGLNIGWLSFGIHKTAPVCPSPLINGNCCPDWQTCGGPDGSTKKVTCDVAPTSAETGQSVTWYVKSLSNFGDPKGLIYTWTGSDGPTGAGTWSDSNSRQENVISYSTSGLKTAGVKVSDGSGEASASCDNGVSVCVPTGGETDSVGADCCSGLTAVDPEGDGTFVCGVPETICSVALVGGTPIKLSINEQTPTYSSGLYYRSTQNQGLTFSSSCSGENLVVTGLPDSGDVIAVCARVGGTLTWGPCTELSSGNYYIGVALLKSVADAGYPGFRGIINLTAPGNSVSTSVTITSTQGS